MAKAGDTLDCFLGLCFGPNPLLQPSFTSRQAHSARALAIGNALVGEKV